MKKLALPKGRKRNTVTLLLCVLLAVLLLAINLLLPYWQRKNNTYIDITPERLYLWRYLHRSQTVLQRVSAPVF